jgi:hypothetical protein
MSTKTVPVWWKKYIAPLIAAVAAVLALAGTVWGFAGEHLVTTRERGDALETRIDKVARRNKAQDHAINYQADVQHATYEGVRLIGKELKVDIPKLPRRPALPPEDDDE